MQLELHPKNSDSISVVRISHGSQYTDWDARNYKRQQLKDGTQLFTVINSYLQKLPTEVQGEIWKSYEAIYDAILDIEIYDNSAAAIATHVNKIYELIDLDALRHHCLFRYSFSYPPTLKDRYDENDPKELTYLRGDYDGLIFLSTALKLMLPIWGEYITRSKPIVGTVVKEQDAVCLIGTSKLIKLPEVDRLEKYIGALTESQQLSATVIHGGIGSESLPQWAFCLSIVRCIAVGEVLLPDYNIIGNVYNHIVRSIGTLDKRFGGLNVQDNSRQRGGTGENESSRAENYRVRQRISDGMNIAVAVYLENYVEVAKRIEPNINVELLKICVERLLSQRDLDITEYNMKINSLMLAALLPGQGLGWLDYVSILRCTGITQCVLYQWGYTDLAHFMTAKSTEMDVNSIDVGVATGISRIQKEDGDSLNEMFPHYRRQGGAKPRTRSDNVASIFVNTLNADMRDLRWTYDSPEEMFPDGRSLNRRDLPVSNDIKPILAKMILVVTANNDRIRSNKAHRSLDARASNDNAQTA